MVAGTVANIAYAVTIYLSTLNLQQVRGLDPLMAGLAFLGPSIAAALGGPLSGRLADKYPPVLVMGFACVAAALSLAALARAGGWVPYICALTACGFTKGLVYSFTTVATQAAVKPERAGEAAGVALTSLVTLAGVGVAASGTMLEAFRRTGMATGSGIEVIFLAIAAAGGKCQIRIDRRQNSRTGAWTGPRQGSCLRRLSFRRTDRQRRARQLIPPHPRPRGRRRGDFINCENGQIPGIAYDGGYAEYMVAPAETLARIPDDLSDVGAAPLLCAGITTFNALRESVARPGDVVAILGLGGLGHLGVQFAVKMGFEVVAIARGEEKGPSAKELGAHHYIDSKASDVAVELTKLGGASVVLGP